MDPASVALVLQILAIYGCASLAKSDPTWRVTGDALGDALRLESFTTALGVQAASMPRALLRFASHAALLMEEFVPFLIFFTPLYSRARIILVATMVLFHGTTCFVFELGLFPYICMAVWMLFMPWNWASNLRVKNGPMYQSGLFRGTEHGAIRSAKCGIVFLASVLSIGSAISSLPMVAFRKVRLPLCVVRVSNMLALSQNWTLFAPRVHYIEGGIRCYALSDEGVASEILGPWTDANSHFTEPFRKYSNTRWREHIEFMWRRDNDEVFRVFASWLMYRYKSEKISAVEICVIAVDRSLGTPPRLTARYILNKSGLSNVQRERGTLSDHAQ
jgi:hypothetical protein